METTRCNISTRISSVVLWFIISLIAIIKTTSCCSIPVGWKPKSIEERVMQAEMVLYVKIAKSPTKWVVSKAQDDGSRLARFVKAKDLYTATVEIYCIYKGDVSERFAKVSKFGVRQAHCVNTEAIEGEKGILFVQRGDAGELVVHETNIQKAFIPATKSNLEKVAKAVTALNIYGPKHPLGVTSGCW